MNTNYIQYKEMFSFNPQEYKEEQETFLDNTFDSTFFKNISEEDSQLLQKALAKIKKIRSLFMNRISSELKENSHKTEEEVYSEIFYKIEEAILSEKENYKTSQDFFRSNNVYFGALLHHVSTEKRYELFVSIMEKFQKRGEKLNEPIQAFVEIFAKEESDLNTFLLYLCNHNQPLLQYFSKETLSDHFNKILDTFEQTQDTKNLTLYLFQYINVIKYAIDNSLTIKDTAHRLTQVFELTQHIENANQIEKKQFQSVLTNQIVNTLHKSIPKQFFSRYREDNRHPYSKKIIALLKIVKQALKNNITITNIEDLSKNVFDHIKEVKWPDVKILSEASGLYQEIKVLIKS